MFIPSYSTSIQKHSIQKHSIQKRSTKINYGFSSSSFSYKKHILGIPLMSLTKLFFIWQYKDFFQEFHPALFWDTDYFFFSIFFQDNLPQIIKTLICSRYLSGDTYDVPPRVYPIVSSENTFKRWLLEFKQASPVI